MVDRHKKKSRVRLDDDHYEYLCKLARRLNPREINCTRALRKIIDDHRAATVGCKWGTSSNTEDLIM